MLAALLARLVLTALAALTRALALLTWFLLASLLAALVRVILLLLITQFEAP